MSMFSKVTIQTGQTDMDTRTDATKRITSAVFAFAKNSASFEKLSR